MIAFPDNPQLQEAIPISTVQAKSRKSIQRALNECMLLLQSHLPGDRLNEIVHSLQDVFRPPPSTPISGWSWMAPGFRNC